MQIAACMLQGTHPMPGLLWDALLNGGSSWFAAYASFAPAALRLQPGSHEGKDGADAAAPPGPKHVRLVAQAKQMGAVIGMKGSTIK